MKHVNVRLADDLHAVLVAAAAASGRSLQREIVMRLDGRVRPLGFGTVESSVEPVDPFAGLPSGPERSFKPDFKGKGKT